MVGDHMIRILCVYCIGSRKTLPRDTKLNIWTNCRVQKAPESKVMGLPWLSCTALPAKAASEGDFCPSQDAQLQRASEVACNAPTFSVPPFDHRPTVAAIGQSNLRGSFPGHPPHPMILIYQVSEETSALACSEVCER
jgi:hypothetical protein